MKILFACLTPVTFDAGTPEREPLGGTESCVCYLARQLAANGHEVSLMTRDAPVSMVMGVRHLPVAVLGDSAFIAGENFAVAIAASNPLVSQHLRAIAPGIRNYCCST